MAPASDLGELVFVTLEKVVHPAYRVTSERPKVVKGITMHCIEWQSQGYREWVDARNIVKDLGTRRRKSVLNSCGTIKPPPKPVAAFSNCQERRPSKAVKTPPKRKKPVHRSIRSRLLARRPTLDLYASRRKKSASSLPKCFIIQHPNPSVFFAINHDDWPSKLPPLGSASREKPSVNIRALAIRPTSKIESNEEESIEHTSQTYSFVDVDTNPPIHIPTRKNNSRRVRCSLTEFSVLWNRAAKGDHRMTTEEIEEEPKVKAGNRSIRRTISLDQKAAQYGRLLPGATDKVFQILGVTRKDVFVDVGAGLANTVLQAAFTIGCQSRGIELVEVRHEIGVQFKKNLKKQLLALIAARGGRVWKNVGKVTLVQGRLEDPENRNFIANCNGNECVKALVNNFDGLFADRCPLKNQPFVLDYYIAGLFAEMKPGSVLVTLHPLSLPRSFSEAMKYRTRHNLDYDADASFYKIKKYVLGKANECVSWSASGSCTNDIIVYRYERLQQKSQHAVFLCGNPLCQSGPIPATRTVEIRNPTGTEERVVINLHCTVCEMDAKPLRRRGSEQAESCDLNKKVFRL